MARRDEQRSANQVGDGTQTAGESGRALRTLALVAVVVGLVALTTAACVLTYSSVHDFALRAGISRSLARIYPDIGDAMLVMAGCSVLALRGAGLLGKVYAWLCFIGLLGVLAGSSVVHEAGLNMPLRAAEITAAVFPWALVLVAFGLLLALLRYARRRRQSQRANPALADGVASSRAALGPPALEAGFLEPSVVELAALEPGAYEGAEEYGGAYEGAGEYEGGEPYEYDTLQATSQYPAVSPETVMSPDEPDGPGGPGGPGEPGLGEQGGPGAAPASSGQATRDLGVVSPASAPPDDAPAQPPRAVIRPAEMQLRARAPRQPEPAESPAADPPAAAAPMAAETTVAEATAADATVAEARAAEATVAEPPAAEATPPTGASVTEPPTSGFTGDTIARGQLTPAPTSDQPSAIPPALDRPRSSPTPPS